MKFLACLLLAGALAIGSAFGTSKVLTQFPEPAGGGIGAMAIDSSRGILYVGGTFTSLGGQSRQTLAAIDLASGAVLPWNPGTDGDVYALAVDPATGVVYVGGSFTVAAGFARKNLAAITAGGAAVPSWDPQPDLSVRTLALQDFGTPRLYVGGYFTTVGIATVPYLAALNPANGQVLPWVPQPDGAVFSILAGSGGAVYAGGSFSNIGGSAHARLAALDPISGGAAGIFTQTISSGYVGTIVQVGSVLYIGGTTIDINGSSRAGGAAAFVASTGAFADWNPIGLVGSAAPTALVPAGGNIYLGGQFTQAGGQPRTNLAAVDPASGLATDWQPVPDGMISRMAAYGSTIFVSGNFTAVDGVARNGFAAINDSNLGPPLEPVTPPPSNANAPAIRAKGKLKISTSKAKVVLRGTATNATLVKYKAGKGSYKTAKGTASNWKIPLKIATARTVVNVYAEGPGGKSPALKFTVRREEK